MDGDVKITITPEEAAALWERFCEDREAAFRPHRHDNDRTAIKHALTLAIARERERCAGIAEDYIKENGDWSGMAGEISLDIAAKIRGEE